MSTDEQLEVTEFLERNAGSNYHRAVTLAMLQSEAEGAYEELRYDPPDQQDAELLAALKLIVDRRFTVTTRSAA